MYFFGDLNPSYTFFGCPGTVVFPLEAPIYSGFFRQNMDDNLPISTKWTLDAVGNLGRTAIKSVYMIVCPKTASKGTGFLLSNGPIITNEHVIRGCNYDEVIGFSSLGVRLTFSKLIADAERDLCMLFPSIQPKDGLSIEKGDTLTIGSLVCTWGFPLGYNGPAPLLSVGYLAGFKDHVIQSRSLKHLVVNGAFNPGNSGGPLFLANENRVIGIVSTKHAPISNYLVSAIQALASNQSGIVFTATDDKGSTKQFVESQLVAEILVHFRNLTQVMIGEAISTTELDDLLVQNNIHTP
jgi:S1-C subfamily serine protease